jgi:hypothetical protein
MRFINLLCAARGWLYVSCLYALALDQHYLSARAYEVSYIHLELLGETERHGSYVFIVSQFTGYSRSAILPNLDNRITQQPANFQIGKKRKSMTSHTDGPRSTSPSSINCLFHPRLLIWLLNFSRISNLLEPSPNLRHHYRLHCHHSTYLPKSSRM